MIQRRLLCDPMDCSLPGSSVHGIFQARVLEWGAIAFSQDRDKEAYLSDLVIFFFFSFLKIQPSGLNLEVAASWNLDDM